MQQLEKVRIDGDVRELHRSPEHLAAGGDFEVTVAISFASSRDTLGETVASLHEQVGAPRFEVLLVSNGTTDDSVEVARAAAAGLPTRVVECRSSGYDSNARNVSMVEAAGDKVLFLDADDTVGATYVAAMAAALDTSPIVTAVWDLQRLNGRRWPELQRRPADPGDWPMRQQGWTYAPAGTLGFRREVPRAVGGFDPGLTFAANNEWCFRAYAAGFEIALAPGAVVHYRLRSQGVQALRQRYRWGVSEVAAAKAAQAYGFPPRTGLRALGVGTAARLLKRLPGVRSGYGRYDLLSALGHAAGRVSGSVKHRSLDL
ncbi:glycosyltransferase [Kineococcus sp. T13]|uniref:glycosyltransferase n=1 Tax=Kineococcus vitellinus TaxID=2696565 RepID=UPI001411E420|nr:glycosyltransferase family A protein [Kineococcus vitellinus]NAZ75171.1 glycosyltransferase [Kineococcus vitellinus]